MVGPPGSRLSRRGGNLVLAPVAATGAGTVPTWDTPDDPAARFEQVMAAQGGPISWPRIVMLQSARPCDVLVRWWGGGGIGAFCFFTMAFAARIAVDCNNIEILASNRTAGANQFFSSIADGDGIQTHNSWVAEWAQAAPPTAGAIRIPPFAAGLRAVSTLGAGSAAVIDLRNDFGTVTGRTPVNAAMVDPSIVVGAASLVVNGLAVGEIVTLSFDLGI